MKKKYADELLNEVELAYDVLAEDFGTSRANPWFEFEIYKELLQEGDRVLDLGCGNGRLFKSLDERKIKYVGMDVSQGLLDKAAKDLKKEKKCKSKFTFKKGSFLKIPYKRPYFDKIISVAAFHHIPSREYRLEALKEMKRVLKKDGTLVISVWNLWNKRYRKYIFESLFRLNKYDFADCFIPFNYKKTGTKRYYHAFRLSEMRVLLREAGFYIVDEAYVTHRGMISDYWKARNFIFIAKPTYASSK